MVCTVNLSLATEATSNYGVEEVTHGLEICNVQVTMCSKLKLEFINIYVSCID